MTRNTGQWIPVRGGGVAVFSYVWFPQTGGFVVWGPHGGRVAQFLSPTPGGVVCGQVVGLLVPVSFTGR